MHTPKVGSNSIEQFLLSVLEGALSQLRNESLISLGLDVTGTQEVEEVFVFPS